MMDDISIEIELLKRCKIDPFKQYSIKDLESIIQGQIKNWNLFAQDSQRSESEKKRFRDLVEKAEYLCSHEDELSDYLIECQEIFLETLNDELQKRFVIRSDGTCVITQSSLDSSVETIINKTGWNIKFTPDMITFDYTISEGDGKNREYGKIIRKLGKLDSGYDSIEDWLNTLLMTPQLNVESTKPLVEKSSYEDYYLVYTNIKKRFDEKAYKNMPQRQDHSEMIGKVGSIIFNTKSNFNSFKTYVSLLEVYNEIDRNYKMGTLNDIYSLLRGIRVNSDVSDVMALIEDYFIEKGYGFSFYELDGDVERCSKCGTLYRDDGKIMSCSKCGNRFFIRCENCGARCSADDSFCSNCSEPLQSYEERINELIPQFKTYISICEFDKADSVVTAMERIKENHPQVRDCRRKLSDIMQDYQKRVAIISDLVGKRKFKEASDLFSQFKRLYPNSASMDSTGAEIERAIRSVDEILSRKPADEHEEYSNYIAASEICTDDSRIRVYFQTHPPKPPSFINIDQSDSDVRIDVDGSMLKNGTEIIITRCEGNVPYTSSDGIQIYRGSSTSFVDTTVIPGVEYYYAAYTIRSQVISTSIVSRKVCILPNPSFKMIDYYPNCIFGTITIPDHSSNVLLERSDSKDGPWTAVKIHISSSSASFSDYDVKQGSTYHYRAIAIYGIHKSEGSTISKSLKEIFPLNISVEKTNNIYYVKEKNHYPFDIILSKELIDTTSGYLPQKEFPDGFEDCSHNIDINNNHIFSPREGFCGYVYAYRKVDNFIVISYPVEVSVLSEVRNLTHMLDGSKCTLIFSIPEEATGVSVLWNDHRYPSGMNDVDSDRRNVTSESHTVNGNTMEIQLDCNEAFFRIVSIYSKNRTSEGCLYHITVKKPSISYGITSKKTGLLSKRSKVTVTFRSDTMGITASNLVVAIGDRMPPRGLDEACDVIPIPVLSFDSGTSEFTFEISNDSIPNIRVLSKNTGQMRTFGLKMER